MFSVVLKDKLVTFLQNLFVSVFCLQDVVVNLLELPEECSLRRCGEAVAAHSSFPEGGVGCGVCGE